MIEIIKKGTKTKTNCNTCGCIFTYEYEDVQIEEGKYRGSAAQYITCPQCSERVYLRMTK